MTEGQFLMFKDIFRIWAKDNCVDISEEAFTDLDCKLEAYYEYYLQEHWRGFVECQK